MMDVVGTLTYGSSWLLVSPFPSAMEQALDSAVMRPMLRHTTESL